MRDREPLYNPITPPPKRSWLCLIVMAAIISVGVAVLMIMLDIAARHAS